MSTKIDLSTAAEELRHEHAKENKIELFGKSHAKKTCGLCTVNLRFRCILLLGQAPKNQQYPQQLFLKITHEKVL